MKYTEPIELPRLEEEYLTDRSFPWKKRPCYALPADATVDDMRAMAVQAMKDSVSIPWQTDNPICYTKALGGAGSYDLEPGIAFSGLPYTSSASGIFQWLEYVSRENGHIEDAPFDRLGFELGNACAPAVSWAQCAVCPSVSLGLICRRYLPVNGYEPVGKVKIPEGVTDYVDYPTKIVQKDAGKEAVLEAYTMALPGDTLIKAGLLPGQHTMMAGETPTVVRDEAGEIDLDKSFIRVVDQRSKEYPVEQDGTDLWLAAARPAERKQAAANADEDEGRPTPARAAETLRRSGIAVRPAEENDPAAPVRTEESAPSPESAPKESAPVSAPEPEEPEVRVVERPAPKTEPKEPVPEKKPASSIEDLDLDSILAEFK